MQSPPTSPRSIYIMLLFEQSQMKKLVVLFYLVCVLNVKSSVKSGARITMQRLRHGNDTGTA